MANDAPTVQGDSSIPEHNDLPAPTIIEQRALSANNYELPSPSTIRQQDSDAGGEDGPPDVMQYFDEMWPCFSDPNY